MRKESHFKLSALITSLLTLTTFLMLLILLVNKLCMRRSSFTWSACLMHMNRMCAGSPGIASAIDLGFISVMRHWITLSSSSPENSIMPRILCCLNWGGRGRRSYTSKQSESVFNSVPLSFLISSKVIRIIYCRFSSAPTHSFHGVNRICNCRAFASQLQIVKSPTWMF